MLLLVTFILIQLNNLGMGKSRFLDYVAGNDSVLKKRLNDIQISKEKLEKIFVLGNNGNHNENSDYLEFKNNLEQACYVTVSFNGATPYSHDENPSHSISIRILYSYFSNSTKCSFDFFRTIMQNHLKYLSVDTTINLIKEHSKSKSVFLCIDEVNKVIYSSLMFGQSSRVKV